MLGSHRQKILKYTEPLTSWQKLYFLAALVAIYELILGSGEYNVELVGALALAALAVELWPKFVETWETLLGRVAVIVTYVIIGNFVVAFARHKLNQVVGVDPDSLFYATSFVSILMAPIWIITITLIAMLLYMLVKQAWFIVTFIPWMLGLYEKSTIQVATHPKTTRVVRIVMLPFMLAFLISVLDTYGDAMNRESPGIEMSISNIFPDDTVEAFKDGEAVGNHIQKQIKENIEPAGTSEPAITEEERSVEDDKLSISIDGPDGIENLAETIKTSTGKTIETDEITMGNLIAEFVYHVEAFEFSQCKTQDKERTVSLGEHDILSVIPDDSPNGYRFTVRACELKNYETDASVN